MKIGIIENNKKPKAISLQAQLLAKYPKEIVLIQNPEEVSTQQLDLFLVLGGDGFLLYSLHNYAKFQLPFFGINCGNVGFLMNNFDSQEALLNVLAQSEPAKIFPLKNEIYNLEQQFIVDYAFNELSMLRATHQALRIAIKVNGITRVEKLIADGLVLSTPLGSTSYNYSLGGPILPINATLLSLVPNSTFRPRFWKGALLSFEDIVEFDILEADERKVNATIDYQEFQQVKLIRCSVDQTKPVTLLFRRELPLTEKTLKEQFADVYYTQNLLNNKELF